MPRPGEVGMTTTLSLRPKPVPDLIPGDTAIQAGPHQGHWKNQMAVVYSMPLNAIPVRSILTLFSGERKAMMARLAGVYLLA